MDLRGVSALLAAFFISLATLLYCKLVVQKKIEPVLVSWIIFTVTVALSFFTYWDSPKHSFISNIGNAFGFLSTTVIFFTVLWAYRREVKLRIAFNSFQTKCLLAAGVVVIFWVITRNAWISNIFIQVLMLIGFFATFYHLWFARRNTEPLLPWIFMYVGFLFSLVTAVMGKDFLAAVYAIRAIFCTIMVICLMLRIEAKKINPSN